MRKAMLPVEAVVIVGGFLAVILVIVAIIVFSWYDPETPPSNQVGECISSGSGIEMKNYNRLAEDAEDAARYVSIIYRSNKLPKCYANKKIDPVMDSCVIGKEENIRIEVNEHVCSFMDLTEKTPVPVNETNSS